METMRSKTNSGNPVETLAAQNEAIEKQVLKDLQTKAGRLETQLGRKEWELSEKQAFLKERYTKSS